jgi:hypothetical protein
VAIQGAQLDVVDDHLARSELGVQSSVSWDVLVGAADVARVSPDELRAAMRRWFSWDETLVYAAHQLGMLGAAPEVAARFVAHAANLAVADEWPARLLGADSLLTQIRRSGRQFVPLNPHGLLWIILDALRSPWDGASKALSEEAASRRFARLVLIAAGGFDLEGRVSAVPGLALGTGERPPFKTANALVPMGRLTEHDDVERTFVRAHDLYLLYLPLRSPGVETIFQDARGMQLRDWILGTCAVTRQMESNLGRPIVQRQVVEFESPENEASNPSLAVLRRLGRTREQFQARLAHPATLEPGALPVRALRETGLLRTDGDWNEYIRMTGVHALYDKLQGRLPIVEPLHTKNYGCIEFAVEDPSGFRLVFSEKAPAS